MALDEAGINSYELLRSIGMDPDKIKDTNHRYSQEQVTNLWVTSAKATNDPHFGLKVARHIRPSTFHVVGYAMSCSSTLRRATERFARSARLISDAASVQFLESREVHQLIVDLHTGGRRPVYHTIDTILSGFFMLCEWILAKPITPVEVTFRHKAPDDITAYADVFRCRILFDQPINSIAFRPEDLEQQIPSANEELAVMLDEMTSQYLAMRFSSRLSRRVRDALISLLPSGQPTKEATARQLAISERTLLRRLQEENTTFQEVLDRLRENLSYDYLKREDLTIDDIAHLLGFSSISTFSRAFLRWTGQRPSIWRTERRRKKQSGETDRQFEHD